MYKQKLLNDGAKMFASVKGELHRFSTLTYVEVLREKTFTAKCECTVQFCSRVTR